MEMTRGEMNDLLSKFATQNPEYRQALLVNPRDVVQRQFQIELPSDVEIKVLEETPDTAYVVLPYAPARGAELVDADLEAVAGGANVKEANCEGGTFNTVNELNANLSF